MFWVLRDTKKRRLEAKTEKAPSWLRQRQTDTDSKFSHISISDTWSELTNWIELHALSFMAKSLWAQPLSHTHESHWYFVVLQIEANTFVLPLIIRVLELNDRTKTLEWHPGMGRWQKTRLPMMFTVRRFDINWIKPLMTRSLWLLRTGHRGHRGHKGLVYHCVFPLRGWLNRAWRARC